MDQKDWNLVDHFIEVDGSRLWVQQILMPHHEAGTTLVFLHDALGAIASWKGFPLQLCRTLNCNGLLFDRLGHGQSDPSPHKRSLNYLEQEAQFVLPQVLKQYNIHDPILIGHSDGASIALLYAAAFENVAKVVALSGHIMVEPITQEGIKESLKAFEDPLLFGKLERIHGAKTKKLIDDWAMVWLDDQFKTWNISAQLHQIQCPVLVIQGQKDQYATPAHCSQTAEAIGLNARSLLLDNCGHFPYKEEADETAHLIVQFIQENSPNT